MSKEIEAQMRELPDATIDALSKNVDWLSDEAAYALFKEVGRRLSEIRERLYELNATKQEAAHSRVVAEVRTINVGDIARGRALCDGGWYEGPVSRVIPPGFGRSENLYVLDLTVNGKLVTRTVENAFKVIR